jgi:predicted transcriptional regulator
MLNNNDHYSWSDFKSDSVNLNPATLSKYLKVLTYMRCVYKVSKGYYMITTMGKKRLSEIENSVLR